MENNSTDPNIHPDDLTKIINSSNTPEGLLPATASTPSRSRLSRLLNNRIALITGVALLFGSAGLTAVLLTSNTTPPATTDLQSQPAASVSSLGVAVGLTEGMVEYSSDARSWQDVTTETDLQEGDSIRTAVDGRAVLLIDDGSAIRLNTNSEAELTSLDPEDIVITNVNGEVYSRVVASNTRSFRVAVDDEHYKAKGTAYRTVNTDQKKGVEVYHSIVEATSDKKDVTEGNYLYSLNEQKDKEGTVLALDLEALKNDSFIKWNSEQDKTVAGYADKLGVLVELDKPAPAPLPTPPPARTRTGISLSGSQSEHAAVFSWSVSGIDVSKGYKLVKSKTSKTPTYPGDSAAYIDAGKRNYTLYIGDGQTYYYRLCAYRGDTCDSYSNTVTVATTKKAEPEVVSGAVSLSVAVNTASWTFAGTAPHGFKVVIGTTAGPTYENHHKIYYVSGTNLDISGGLNSGTEYYVRVCKYTNSGCVDYSNEVTYKP